MDIEEEQYDDEGQAIEWQIDPETPSAKISMSYELSLAGTYLQLTLSVNKPPITGPSELQGKSAACGGAFFVRDQPCQRPNSAYHAEVCTAVTHGE